jgi:hypothetical protein
VECEHDCPREQQTKVVVPVGTTQKKKGESVS